MVGAAGAKNTGPDVPFIYILGAVCARRAPTCADLRAAILEYSQLPKGVDVDGPDPFWSAPGAGWAAGWVG